MGELIMSVRKMGCACGVLGTVYMALFPSVRRSIRRYPHCFWLCTNFFGVLAPCWLCQQSMAWPCQWQIEWQLVGFANSQWHCHVTGRLSVTTCKKHVVVCTA